MRVKVRGKTWTLTFPATLKTKGICDSPRVPYRKIRIRSTLQPRMALDTTIHELLHAALWDLGEEAITETATDVAAVLWRLGYRRKP